MISCSLLVLLFTVNIPHTHSFTHASSSFLVYTLASNIHHTVPAFQPTEVTPEHSILRSSHRLLTAFTATTTLQIDYNHPKSSVKLQYSSRWPVTSLHLKKDIHHGPDRQPRGAQPRGAEVEGRPRPDEVLEEMGSICRREAVGYCPRGLLVSAGLVSVSQIKLTTCYTDLTAMLGVTSPTIWHEAEPSDGARTALLESQTLTAG